MRTGVDLASRASAPWTYPATPIRYTSTMGGKGLGIGLAREPLLQRIRSSARSKRRVHMYTHSGCAQRMSGANTENPVKGPLTFPPLPTRTMKTVSYTHLTLPTNREV